VEYVLVDAAPFRAAASATDQEVAARFQAQRESYRIPERRVLGYVLVDPAALQAQAQGQVTDADVEAFYRDNERQFEQAEEACARHILVKVKSTPEAPGHTEEEARALAQKLLDQVKAGGDFAEIARKSSEDAGSASRGGDLDCFGPGRMVPEFDQAVFSMQPGQISDLVRTQHGFHIIQVTSRKEATTRPLSEVREPIKQTLVSRKVHELAEQKSAQVAAALEGGDSLEKAAQAQGLTVQKSAPVARDDQAPPLDSAELMSRAFLLRRGETHKQPFRTSRGWVFVSVLDVQPSRLPELAEVKDRVRTDLVEAKARAQAQARALEVRARAQAEGLDKAAAALGLVRKETPTPVGRGEAVSELGATQQLEDAVFGLAPQALSDPLPVPAGYAVVRVTDKTGFDPAVFAQQKASITSSLEQQLKQRLFQSYVESARARFPVERRPAALRRITS
jgi:peptidyl-prolyl cis-trans isomerase D